jgi:hypothetical protein
MPPQFFKRAVYGHHIIIDQNVEIRSGSGAPTDGTTGTGAGSSAIGSLYIDYTNGGLYLNGGVGTKASPAWLPISSSTGSVPVVNETGSTIAQDKLVLVSGYETADLRESISLAVNNIAQNAAQYVTAGSVLDEGLTDVVKFGLSAATLNTSAASAVGSLAYLDSTAGGFTFTKPTAANSVVQVVGVCVVKDASVGQIYWLIQDVLGFGSNELQANSVTTAALTTTLGKGTLEFPLTGAALATRDTKANFGGMLATDSSPSILAVNGSTDPSQRITWAASSVVPIIVESVVPDDADITVAATLLLTAGMNGATDTPVVTVGVFVGVGATDAGSATTALSNAQVEKSISVTLPAGAPGKKIIVRLTPGAHGTNTLLLDAVRMTYTRK